MKALLFVGLLLASGLAHSQTPPAALWSSIVRCSVSSVIYYDFSKADPLQLLHFGIAGLPKLSVDIDTAPVGNHYASLKVPGTDFQIDFNYVDFTNEIGGTPTDFKSLRFESFVRQNGHVVANATISDRQPATNVLMAAAGSMNSNVAAEAKYMQLTSRPSQARANYIRQLAPSETVVLDEVLFICFASKK